MKIENNTLFKHYLESTEKQEILFIQLEQDLKMENSPVFSEQFDLLNTNDLKAVLLDFSKVRFIDSTGLGLLIKYATELKENRGIFYISGLRHSLFSVFRLAGLFNVFEILDETRQNDIFPYLSFTD